MDFTGAHILSTKQFDKESLMSLFQRAREMEEILKSGEVCKICDGKILATLFFEPSTRTRFSFETAMNRLGGRVVSGPDMIAQSSHTKGETLQDTGKVMSHMVDVVAMRHPEPGSVMKLAEKCDCPVINAGDGANEHPTQALLDLYTIWKEFNGEIDGFKVGMIGDLKYGRVPHSQCDLLKHFDVEFVFVSPDGLKMPLGIVNELTESGHKVHEVEDIAAVIGDMDVIAMTRIQKERFETEQEYLRYEGAYVLNKGLMEGAKADSIVIHPLPRIDEISFEVDDDVRAKYFEQVGNGVAVRMALLAEVLGC